MNRSSTDTHKKPQQPKEPREPAQPRARKDVSGFAALLVVLLALCALLTGGPVWSRTVLDLDTQRQPILLKDWGDFWLDKSGQLSASEVNAVQDKAWQLTQNNAIYPISVGQALWIRFTVPPAPDLERWYLEVPYPSINRATLLTQDSADQWTEQKAGDLVPVASWPVPHRHPLLPLAVSAEVPTQYLLRLENGHSFGIALRFVSESRLSYSEQRVSLILGIFFGLVGLAVVVSVLSGVSLRDTAYGYYAKAAALMGLTQATATGIAGLHLWPNAPLWNDASSYVLPTLALTAKLMFASAAVALPERSMPLYRTVQAVCVLGIVAAAALLWVPMQLRMTVLMSYVFLPQLLAFYILLWAWRRGDRFAPWLMLGFTPVVVTAALVGARNVGWLPVGFLTVNAAQIAVAIELPILLVVLMLRSQVQRENKRRILGLDRVDPNTGLINTHVFAQRLARMIARSERFDQQSAVLLVDIINTDDIEQDFGRKAAKELPVRVAERLLSIAREIDSAASLSELRFGMLVEGPISADEAKALGPRIVARCLMPFKELPSECVAEVRVAYALVPRHGASAQSLLTRLGDKLSAASQTGDKRAVFMLAEPNGSPSRLSQLA